MTVIMCLIGLLLLLAGGEILVRGGVGLAQRMRVTPAVVGVVVLGFGTSMPEMVTSLQAAGQGAAGIAIGNVIGSNIANILLILALAVLIAPVTPAGAVPRLDLWALGLATGLGAGLVLLGEVSRLAGFALLVLLAAYLWRAVGDARRAPGEQPELTLLPPPLWRAAGLALGGIALTIWGAHLLVTAAVDLARGLGVSEVVIGLTLVAVGTSLPELAATVMAAIRGQGRMALGNIVGSNVFNILGILGVTAMVFPIDVPADIAAMDLALFLGAGLCLLLLLVRPRIGRGAGAAMLAAYLGYIGWLAT
ncbi:calcium/sodium antiporter [Rhodophyticola porphyridii]|uniref:Sodium:calcium antiporter n=1 Tax=Rhodophyticola porphyridii TaxID=1852017 RepID=A0A3L9Y9K1_9RHOB|nr:calcium/sodium antiporter [Rhodophyticola porphyridii]RMA44225.1 sodium:calcium antiporter [Rhodophyticola porphyridii]